MWLHGGRLLDTWNGFSQDWNKLTTQKYYVIGKRGRNYWLRFEGKKKRQNLRQELILHVFSENYTWHVCQRTISKQIIEIIFRQNTWRNTKTTCEIVARGQLRSVMNKELIKAFQNLGQIKPRQMKYETEGDKLEETWTEKTHWKPTNLDFSGKQGATETSK